MLRRVVLFFLLLISGMGCASQKPATQPAQGAESKRPRWVDTPPSNPEFFYGVSAAPGTGAPAEDRQRADYAARIDIASQLKITITSVVADLMQYKQISTGKKTREGYTAEYSQRMSAIVDTTALEGSKVIQRWHDPQTDTYYAWASMSKSEFRERIRRRLENAQNLAMDQYFHALKAQQSGNVPAALRYYANALTELEVIQDIPFEIDLDGDGTKEYFRPEVRRRVEEIASELQILTINDAQKAKVGKPLEKPLVVKVLYRDFPVKDLPVAFDFIRGQGQLDRKSLTNSHGLASSKVYKLESVGSCVVGATAQLAEIVGAKLTMAVVRVEDPQARFSIMCEPVRVTVRIWEQNLEIPVVDSFVEAAIVAELTQAGFAVISAEESQKQLSTSGIEQAMGGNNEAVRQAGRKLEADVVIVGRASTIFSSQALGTAKCSYARATVRAIEVSSGEVVAASDLSQVKGFANTAEKAGLKALKEVSLRISEEIAEQLSPERR